MYWRIDPLCCKNGWKLAFCNSRHLSPGESNYAPIEGEALGVVWALKKARMFPLEKPKFIIFVDHKPLLKILGDKSLCDIDDPRLLGLKEKPLAYSFDIKYMKGLKNHANVFFCYPVGKPDDEDTQLSTQLNNLALQVAPIATESAAFITLSKLQEYCQANSQYHKLLQKVKSMSLLRMQQLRSHWSMNFII